AVGDAEQAFTVAAEVAHALGQRDRELDLAVLAEAMQLAALRDPQLALAERDPARVLLGRRRERLDLLGVADRFGARVRRVPDLGRAIELVATQRLVHLRQELVDREEA